MRPSDALRELFEQHDALRASMDDCEAAADDIDGGHADFGRLARHIKELRVAFESHNLHEESVLSSILRELDAVGDPRLSYLMDDHVDERRTLRGCLDGPTGEVRAGLYCLRAHLAAEERIFSSARDLRDDIGAIDLSG